MESLPGAAGGKGAREEGAAAGARTGAEIVVLTEAPALVPAVDGSRFVFVETVAEFPAATLSVLAGALSLLAVALPLLDGGVAGAAEGPGAAWD